jgi:hypothetical protein
MGFVVEFFFEISRSQFNIHINIDINLQDMLANVKMSPNGSQDVGIVKNYYLEQNK